MWNTETDAEERFRNRAIWGSAAAVLILAVGAFVYFKYFAHPAPPPEAAAAPGQVLPANAQPAIQHPIPQGAAEAKPLPALNDSDQELRDSLVGLFGQKPVDTFLNPENIVRHIVATLDNLPRNKVAVELRPVKPTAGETAVSSQGEMTTLAVANSERYAPFIKAVQASDPRTLATVYFRLYPLFQQAYEDLGYPGQYFNDRLVQVIDDLLAAPEVKGPVQLVQPKVFYEYKDPGLESRSAGQKLMIRMGSANAAIVKGKLRELRAAIVQQGRPATTARPPAPAAPTAAAPTAAAPTAAPGAPTAAPTSSESAPAVTPPSSESAPAEAAPTPAAAPEPDSHD